MEYCPECIIELNKQKKKLGGLTNWLVCPGCGFRKRPTIEWQESNNYLQRKENHANAKRKADILREESD